MEELISVIIPVYNVEKYLQKCVDSVLSQSYANIEVILVDDGSTDASPIICDRYKAQNEQVVVIHQQNGGLSAARNAGISIAKGKYICFVDSDDYIVTKMVENLYNNLTRYNADISVCDFWWADENELIENETSTISEVKIFSNQLQILMQLFDNYLPTVVAWNKLYRRELWDGLKYPIGRLHEDEYVIHELLYKCRKIVYSNEKMYFYIQHPASITHKMSRKRVIDAIEAYEDRLQFARNLSEPQFYKRCGSSFVEVCRDRIKTIHDMEDNEAIRKEIIHIMDKDKSLVLESKALSFRKKLLIFAWENDFKLFGLNKCFERDDRWNIRILKKFF